MDNIENLLKSQPSPAASAAPPERHIHTPWTDNGVPITAATVDPESNDDEPAIDGDSGLRVHTVHASEFLEQAVESTHLRNVDHRMEATLADLRQLVEMQKSQPFSHGPRFPLQQPVPAGGVIKLPMPPVAAVMPLLKQSEGKKSHDKAHVRVHALTSCPASHPNHFTILCSLVGISDFSSLCDTVYFATERFSEATFTVVNAMLYNLFIEQDPLDPAIQEEYYSYSELCRANLETALANMPLFTSAKLENVQALLLGVSSLPVVGYIPFLDTIR